MSQAVQAVPSVPLHKNPDFPAESWKLKSQANLLSYEIHEALLLGDLSLEKCALAKAEEAFLRAYELSTQIRDSHASAEALLGLLRIAHESLDQEKIRKWESRVEHLLQDTFPNEPALLWYCKGAVLRFRGKYRQAQKCVHRYLKQAGREGDVPDSAKVLNFSDAEARAWSALAVLLFLRGHEKRARWLVEEVLRRFETRKARRVNGSLYLVLAGLAEHAGDYVTARQMYQNAHASFMAEHNWHSHLQVLLGYARLERAQRNFTQAYWHLDLIEKAASTENFAALRKEIAAEREKLKQEAVDLLIDGSKGYVKTREGGEITFRKQYVLLDMLEALSEAERGLSKAELVRRVWREDYKPAKHDNKLYYNVNRLRKLIEPDSRHPRYLINWREGYRLAPGLRVRKVSARLKTELGR